MSIGESRVRMDDGPLDDVWVWDLKTKTAALIDLCELLKSRDGRLAALAQTAYEEACIWAVKAATAEPTPDPSDT